MQSLTSISQPALFADAPVLPAGFHYLLQKVGEYQFGVFNPVYLMGIVKEADQSIVWGNSFYPYDGYPSGAEMIVMEANNLFGQWNQYYLADEIAAGALTAIGF